MTTVRQPFSTFLKKGTTHIIRKAKGLSPSALWCGHKIHQQRSKVENYLARLTFNNDIEFNGLVLVDGLFDNPNFWLRYALFRKAIGIKDQNQFGMIGPFNRRKVQRTFATFDIPITHDFLAIEKSVKGQAEKIARTLIKTTKDANDILTWSLPGELPTGFLYDGLLRRQRAAVVDITHYKFEADVIAAISSILAAQHIINSGQYSLLVLSHNFDFKWSALVWFGFKKNIPSVMLYGNFGVFKFCRMNNRKDIYCFFDHPSGTEIDNLKPHQATAASDIGQRYLDLRLSGKTQDLGAVYAFQTDQARSLERADLCEKLGWDASKKITAVYAGNWWDNIHGLGMRNFRDLHDWLHCTLDAASKNKDVNWLIKGHPVDRWYGGKTLSDVLPKSLPDNIRIVPDNWNNLDVISLADGVVTIHGTVGLEFAFSGKPVLLADRGWYHECGFALWSQSKDEYLSHLSTNWETLIDLTVSKQRAKIFAGLCCCCPSWQQDLIFRPDTDRDDIYSDLQKIMVSNSQALENEIQTISKWFESSSPYYHVFKMLNTDTYALSNVRR